MNSFIAKYLLYYPVTLVRGELVGFYLNQYRKNQYLEPESLVRLQQDKALKLIKFAAKNSVFYKKSLGRFLDRFDRGCSFAEAFSQVPVITKQDLIEHSAQMTTYLRYISTKKTTGGSTGEPVTIFKNPNALARERAATWRAYEWAKIKVGASQGRFWGVPHNGLDSKKAKLIDLVSNRKRISAFNITDSFLKQYHRELTKFRPRYLYGYVSVINEFANFIIEEKLKPIESITAVITTSEVLTLQIRSNIEGAFKVKVFNEYGCGEVGSIAHECESGSLHIMADNLIIETEGKDPNSEIIVTDLFNYAQPLIRYKVGDFGSLTDKECSCGRTLPIISGIHGRAYDLIKIDSGKSIHPEAIMYIFEDISKHSPGFSKFQFIQESLSIILVKIVPNEKWENNIQSQITKMIKEALNDDIQIKYELVDVIPREASGKMRVVKSLI